jgi:hypothetical protein
LEEIVVAVATCKHWFVLVVEGIVNTVGGFGVWGWGLYIYILVAKALKVSCKYIFFSIYISSKGVMRGRQGVEIERWHYHIYSHA